MAKYLCGALTVLIAALAPAVSARADSPSDTQRLMAHTTGQRRADPA